jgi:hypothetical protein
MTDDRPSDLLSALPRSRPHRRSDKRPARAAASPEPSPPSSEAGRAKAVSARGKSPAAAKPAHGSARAPRTSAKPARPAAKSRSAAKPRAAQPARRRPDRLPQPAQPRGVPQAARGTRPQPTTDFPVLRTALQAAGELAEIGLTLSAQALRRAIGRFPRP